jgi:hypothetical protein
LEKKFPRKRKLLRKMDGKIRENGKTLAKGGQREGKS